MAKSNNEIVSFDKYKMMGAYHWLECDPRSKQFNPPLVARYKVVIDALKSLPRRDCVLDIGCGDAYLIANASEYCKELVGIDPEPDAIRLAKEIVTGRYTNCDVQVGDCYKLDYSDSVFDVVLLTDVIEHLKTPSDCLSEVARVLRSTGSLVVTTPRFQKDRKWDERHEKEYTADELRSLLEKHFSSIEMYYFWPLVWSRFYRSRVGWRVCKLIARYLYNPFTQISGSNCENYGQLMAVCSNPGK